MSKPHVTNKTMLETPIEGLYATPPQPLPFDPSVDVRAFLLERADGNLLVYNAPGLAPAAGEIRARGGAVRHYLNHAHEAMFGPQGVHAGVFVHERDRAETSDALPVAVAGTFSKRHTIADDFEVIPIPGHTPGATAFLWATGHHRLLFTGDSLWLDDGDWRAVLLDSSNRRDYAKSLRSLRELEFDVLVPWGATAGRPYLDVVSRDQAEQAIDTVLARVERGENR